MNTVSMIVTNMPPWYNMVQDVNEEEHVYVRAGDPWVSLVSSYKPKSATESKVYFLKNSLAGSTTDMTGKRNQYAGNK